jgi:hypothetical protein
MSGYVMRSDEELAESFAAYLEDLANGNNQAISSYGRPLSIKDLVKIIRDPANPIRANYMEMLRKSAQKGNMDPLEYFKERSRNN